jgi:hypothetical protein
LCLHRSGFVATCDRVILTPDGTLRDFIYR